MASFKLYFVRIPIWWNVINLDSSDSNLRTSNYQSDAPATDPLAPFSKSLEFCIRKPILIERLEEKCVFFFTRQTGFRNSKQSRANLAPTAGQIKQLGDFITNTCIHFELPRRT